MSHKYRLYDEPLRPQFHFTSKKNWLNDPNGLVYYKGEYHLFFQHNPKENRWGNMTWGHAVSKDLLHWTQLPNAIKPDKRGMIFSGSAVVDERNVTGFKTGKEPPIVAFFTYSSPDGMSQAIAYSNDRGRTFKKYSKNPILGPNRDPKVLWHEESGRWVMVLYNEHNKKDCMEFYTSDDLKSWTYRSRTYGQYECPDLVKLPVDGNPKQTRWVLFGGKKKKTVKENEFPAYATYAIGQFDGEVFRKESGPHKMDFGLHYYATQCYNNVPSSDGRTIVLAWMNTMVSHPGMPFSQQMSFPCEIGLTNTPHGIRLIRKPVDEIRKLYGDSLRLKNRKITSDENIFSNINSELLDITMTIKPQSAKQVKLNIRGAAIVYNTKKQSLEICGRSAKCPLVQGAINLRILADRSSVEVFADNGRLPFSYGFIPDTAKPKLAISAIGGTALLTSAEIHKLRSIWK